MKNPSLITSVIVALALAVLPAKAQSPVTYPDATGDFTGGTAALDMTSVVVNNDSSTLTFTINLAGDPTAATWYNYLIGISENLYGGVGGTSPWGHSIAMSVGGLDYFVGTWNPGSTPATTTSFDFLTWNGASWNTLTGTSTRTSTSVTIPLALSSLGLAAGNSFTFDVWTTTQSGNNVLDALSDNTPRSWNNNAFDTGANALSYTVQAVQVPEPCTCALLGLGALGMMVRRRISAR
jgi:hypothetical protein